MTDEMYTSDELYLERDDIDSQSKMIFPEQWVRPVDPVALKLKQKLQRGYFRFSLEQGQEIQISADTGSSSNLSEPGDQTVFFETQYGIVGFEPLTSLLECLTSLPFSENPDIDFDKWCRICIQYLPEDFVSFWGYLIPAPAISVADMSPVKLLLVENESGISVRLWALQRSWRDLFNANTVDYIARPAVEESVSLTAQLQLGRCFLSHQELDSLNSGDFIIPDQMYLFDEQATELIIFNRHIHVTLHTDDGQLSLQVEHNELRETPQSDFGSAAWLGSISPSIHIEEICMNADEDNDPEMDDIDQKDPSDNSISCAKVMIDVCLGTFSLNFNDAQLLESGSLIAIDSEYNGKVSLRNNGVEVGIGSIVSVNEKLAIAVDKIWS